jgi:hypothetical protein
VEVSELLRSSIEYEYRTIIVKGKLETLNVDDYVLRDRRSLDQSIRVVFLSASTLAIPVGDEVEVTGVLRVSATGLETESSMREPPRGMYIDVRSIDSLAYDVRPSDIEPSTELSSPKAKTPPAPSGPPPEVVFTLPLDQEQGIDLDTEFRIQFSEDMYPASFEGNVALQYANQQESTPEVELNYDVLSRTLVVKSATLKPAQEIRLILYEGIVDENGVPLLPVLLSRRASMDRRTGRRKVLTLTYFTRE